MRTPDIRSPWQRPAYSRAGCCGHKQNNMLLTFRKQGTFFRKIYQFLLIYVLKKCNCGRISFKNQIVSVPHKVRTYKEYHSVCPSSELGLPPTPHPQASVPPPPCFWGEGGTLAGEKGVGRVPIPTRGIHCGTLYMYVLCAVPSSFHTKPVLEF
jgi:hypothetical protein